MGKIDCDENELIETTTAVHNMFSGSVFDCIIRDVKLPDGTDAKREVIVHTGGSCILPVDENLDCYMVKQFRSGAEMVLLEVPAGKIEEGESAYNCAVREIVEETGFEAGKVEDLGFFFPTPAYCSEKIHLFLGTNLKYVGGDPDSGEFLGVQKMSLKELVDMCDRGDINDGKTMACIYKAARRFLK